MDIDVQGVKQIKQTDLSALYIFLKPPCLQTLEKRLRARGTETEETLQRRLNVAREEMEYGMFQILDFEIKYRNTSDYSIFA